MGTTLQLQKEIRQEERAIRHLLSERDALSSRIKREEAKLKIEEARLRDLTHTKVGKKLEKESRFPDVSNNNGTVDVHAVRHASGVKVGDLMVTKITEGTFFVDRPGLVRAKAMTANKFPRRGFYCFLHPSESGVAQAEFLLSTLESVNIKLTSHDIVVGDLEVSDGETAPRVRGCASDFGHTIKEHHDGIRWLYGGGPFAAEFGITLDGYHDHWLAAYVSDPEPFMHFGHRTKAWQYTDGRFGPNPHACPGIGPCDLSVVLR